MRPGDEEKQMLFCKEPTCKSLAVVGGYCLSHQLERANELYAQLNQRNDSGSRMSREITERIANESQLKQRSTTAERERDGGDEEQDDDDADLGHERGTAVAHRPVRWCHSSLGTSSCGTPWSRACW